MKRILTLVLAGLLVMIMAAGAAWAKPAEPPVNAKVKAEVKAEVKAIQQYKARYKALVQSGKAEEVRFKDVTENHWANGPIKRMVALGLFAGYDDGTFKPDKNISRVEMIALAMRLADADDEDEEETLSSADENRLKGVPAWARESVRKAAKMNIMSLNRFHSQQQATRAEACVAIAKAMGLKKVDTGDIPFADSILIDEDDLGYILAMYRAGYIKGNPGNMFLPERVITRSEIAAILERILADLEKDNDGEDEYDFAALESGPVGPLQ